MATGGSLNWHRKSRSCEPILLLEISDSCSWSSYFTQLPFYTRSSLFNTLTPSCLLPRWFYTRTRLDEFPNNSSFSAWTNYSYWTFRVFFARNPGQPSETSVCFPSISCLSKALTFSRRTPTLPAYLNLITRVFASISNLKHQIKQVFASNTRHS